MKILPNADVVGWSGHVSKVGGHVEAKTPRPLSISRDGIPGRRVLVGIVRAAAVQGLKTVEQPEKMRLPILGIESSRLSVRYLVGTQSHMETRQVDNH